MFCLQLQEGSENTKKTKRFSKEEIKKQLIDSITNNDIFKTEELNEKADKAGKPEGAAAIIKQYEDIIRTKKKNISKAYHQGKDFKRFKHKKKFIKLVHEFKVHKGTMISVTLDFLKNYCKDIKEISNKNLKIFKAYLTIMHYKVHFV